MDIQPQAAPSVLAQSGPIAPQSSSAPSQAGPPMGTAQGTAAMSQGSQQPNNGAPGDDQSQQDPSALMQTLEQHLNNVPPQQQKYLSQFMTPELATLFGIVLGQVAFDYFRKFADPQKELTVIPRKQPMAATQGPAEPQQNAQPSANPAPQSQPQAAPPNSNIMGV